MMYHKTNKTLNHTKPNTKLTPPPKTEHTTPPHKKTHSISPIANLHLSPAPTSYRTYKTHLRPKINTIPFYGYVVLSTFPEDNSVNAMIMLQDVHQIRLRTEDKSTLFWDFCIGASLW